MEENTRNPESSVSTIKGLIILLLTLLMWSVVGVIVAGALFSVPALQSDLGIFFITFVPYILMFFTLLLSCRFVLGSNIRALIRPKKNNWRYGLVAGVVYFLGVSISTLFNIGSIEKLEATPLERLSFLLPVLILVTMETFSEEIFFRALPARIIYGDELPKGIKGIPLMLISGLLFLTPHLSNPEVTESGYGTYAIVFYFLWGVMAMGMGIYTGGFEASIAMHSANNLFIALFVNYENSAMPSKAFFLDRSETSSLRQIVTAVLFYLVTACAIHILKKKTEFLEP